MKRSNSRPPAAKPQENNKNYSTAASHVIRPPARHSQRPTLRNLNPVFHKREKSEDNNELSEKILKLARKTGTLNLSSRGLATENSDMKPFKEQVRAALKLAKNRYFKDLSIKKKEAQKTSSDNLKLQKNMENLLNDL